MKRIAEKFLMSRDYKKLLKILINYNPALFPFLWALAVTFSLVEVYMYAGFISKHIFLGTKFFIFLTFVSGFLSKIYKPRRKKTGPPEYYKILSVLNNLFFLPLIIITMIFMLIEFSHYRNYVFSAFHLQPQNLYWVCFLSFFLVLLNLIDFLEVRFAVKTQTVELMFTLAVVLGLLLMVIEFDVYRLGRGVGENLLYMIRHPLNSYDQKMVHFWGDYYNYMIFIGQNTPDDGVIQVPAQRAPWLMTGNRALDKYFLYPREVIHEKEDPYAPIDPRADYVAFVWGYWSRMEGDAWYGWPKEEIPTEWIIYKKKDSTEIEKKIENILYVPEDEINNEANGLIKVKKE